MLVDILMSQVPKTIKRNILGLNFGYGCKVIGITNKRKEGNICWLCVCECGNEFITTNRSIKKGDIKSCKECRGKIKSQKQTKDLTGYKWNGLEVIRRDYSKQNSKYRTSYWLVKCYCGKEFITFQINIKRKPLKGCKQCSSKLGGQKTIKYKKGFIFGKNSIIVKCLNTKMENVVNFYVNVEFVTKFLNLLLILFIKVSLDVRNVILRMV
jgi:predicted SprT family Zn-dependent metalloprotease